MPSWTGAVTPSGNAPRVCVPQAAQRQLCTRCPVTISGLGSGRSNTCRATCRSPSPHSTGHRTPHRPLDNGQSWHRVFQPGEASRPEAPLTPVFLPDGSRRLLTRGGFFSRRWKWLAAIAAVHPETTLQFGKSSCRATTSARSKPFSARNATITTRSPPGSDAVSRGYVVGQCHRHVNLEISRDLSVTFCSRIPVLPRNFLI